MPTYNGNANDNLAATLGGEIVAGVYPEGGRLPGEAVLLERFRVSRPTLREAFRTLSSKGLIVSRQRVGASVRPRTQWSVLDPELLAWRLRSPLSLAFVSDLFQLREMVEPQAAALAASGGNFAAVRKISDAYSQLEIAIEERSDVISADVRFHQAILEAVDNPFITALGAVIDSALRGSLELCWQVTGLDFDYRLQQHKAILSAIQARDPATARASALELIRGKFEDLRRDFARHEQNLAEAGNDASAQQLRRI